MGASLQPRQPPLVPRKPDSQLPKMTTTKDLREKLANKQVGLVWNPPHFGTLPDQVSLWDGRNTRNPPKWAKKKASILEITNKVNFWVKSDFLTTTDSFLSKITQTNGVNFESKIEALCSLFPVSQMPEVVIFHETSRNRMTEGKSTNSVSIPYQHLPALLNTLRQISRE
jgi:hypothetical protein